MAVLLELYGVLGDDAPDTRAEVGHMQLTTFKRADTQLQHCVQLYEQEAQHALNEQGTSVTCSYITNQFSGQISALPWTAHGAVATAQPLPHHTPRYTDPGHVHPWIRWPLPTIHTFVRVLTGQGPLPDGLEETCNVCLEPGLLRHDVGFICTKRRLLWLARRSDMTLAVAAPRPGTGSAANV